MISGLTLFLSCHYVEKCWGTLNPCCVSLQPWNILELVISQTADSLNWRSIWSSSNLSHGEIKMASILCLAFVPVCFVEFFLWLSKLDLFILSSCKVRRKKKRKKETKIPGRNVVYCELKKNNCGCLGQTFFLFKHKLQLIFALIYGIDKHWGEGGTTQVIIAHRG